MEDKKLKDVINVHDAVLEALKDRADLPLALLGSGLYLAAVRFAVRFQMSLPVEERYACARGLFESAIELDRAIETAVAEALSGKSMK